MYNFFLLLGYSTAAIGIAGSVIYYFSRQIFESYLKRSIEKYKSELERVNTQHQIIFSSLHKERAEVIKTIYYLLFEYKKSVLGFFFVKLNKSNPYLDLAFKVKMWSDTAPAFSNTFHKYRIFFTEDLCRVIDEINNELDVIKQKSEAFVNNYSSGNEQAAAIMNESDDFKIIQKEADALLKGKIRTLELELEREFRKLLGVDIAQVV